MRENEDFPSHNKSQATSTDSDTLLEILKEDLPQISPLSVR
jgi:hypothetical protein